MAVSNGAWHGMMGEPMLWREGEAITVEVSDAGRPRSLTWRGYTFQVEAVNNRWRVSDEWWRAEPAAWREYIKLTTVEGMACLIALDLDSGQWWFIRLYD